MRIHPTPLRAAKALARRLEVTRDAGGHIRNRHGVLLAHGWIAWARIGVLTGAIRPVDGGYVVAVPVAPATMSP